MKRVLACLMIALFLNVSIAGADCLERRMQFARGRTSTVLRGTVSAARGICYKVRVREGQRMTVRLISPGGRARLTISPDEYDAEPLALEVTDWEGELSSNSGQGNFIVAISAPASASYTLEVTIR